MIGAKKIARKLKARIKKTLRPEPSPSYDISRKLPNVQIQTIFDVGANHGQGLAGYAKYFGNAAVHAFEPWPDKYRKLTEAAARFPRVLCHPMAFGAKRGSMRFQADANATMTRVATSTEGGGPVVQIMTVDEFCAERSIGGIGFLKIDTEGHDLDVLQGASEMLTRGAINVVEVEAGMNRDNTYHVPLIAMQSYLEDRGYRLFGLYEQVNEWPTKQPYLRRANAVFVSPETIAASTPYTT